jgi:hypothetical protein
MRVSQLSALAITVVALVGCDRHGDVEGAGHHPGGRYQGIGIYPADELWSRTASTDADKDQSRALRADDGQIIVVVDSQTGEVRQCGNLSGYCVTMNPWSRALGAARAAPVGLTKHAAELAKESTASPDRQTGRSNATARP